MNLPSTAVIKTTCKRVKEHLGYRLRTLKWRKMKLKTKAVGLEFYLPSETSFRTTRSKVQNIKNFLRTVDEVEDNVEVSGDG